MFSHEHMEENKKTLLKAKPLSNDGSRNNETLSDFYALEEEYHMSKAEALLCLKNNLYPELA